MRLSLSANSTPLATPGPLSAHDGYFTVSNDREDEDGREKKGKNKRRLSGPAGMPPAVIQSRPSGHVVDGNLPHRSHSHSQLAGHGQWGHPYQYPAGTSSHHHHHRRPRPEDSPSPMSSDSEPLPPAAASPSYPATRTHSHSQSLSVHHTPSTSPFLGPLRTLNLHSEGPSRAASPFRLSSTVLDGDLSGSPVEDHPLSPSRSSLVGSPPRHPSFSDIRNRSSVEISPSSSFSMPSSGHFQAGRGSRFVSTPQLSSGPSSNDSSPGSYPNSLASSTTRSQPDVVASNGSSRAASPPLSNNSVHLKTNGSSFSNHLPHPPQARDRESGPAHRNLAHSLRVAFGMTPIHPHPATAYGGPGSNTTPGGATPLPASLCHVHPLSMPASRSSSPPIILPPLKFGPSNRSSCPTSPIQDAEMEDATAPSSRTSKSKIELPGFSEFTAASGIRNPPA